MKNTLVLAETHEKLESAEADDEKSIVEEWQKE